MQPWCRHNTDSLLSERLRGIIHSRMLVEITGLKCVPQIIRLNLFLLEEVFEDV